MDGWGENSEGGTNGTGGGMTGLMIAVRGLPWNVWTPAACITGDIVGNFIDEANGDCNNGASCGILYDCPITLELRTGFPPKLEYASLESAPPCLKIILIKEHFY